MNHARFVRPLSPEQVQALEQLYRTGRSHRVRQRAHAVLLSAKAHTLDRIAEVLEVDRDAVSRTLDRWEQGAVAALEERARPGRPSKVDATMEAEVVAAAQESPASVRRTLAKRGRSGVPATTHSRKDGAPWAGAGGATADAPASRPPRTG